MPPSSSRRRAAAAFTASLVDLHLPGPDRPPKVRRLQRGVRRQAVRRWGKVTHSLAKGRTIGHTLESERPRNKSSASHTPAAAMMPLGPIKTPMSDTSCPRNPDLSQWPSCSAQCRTKCVGGWGVFSLEPRPAALLSPGRRQCHHSQAQAPERVGKAPDRWWCCCCCWRPRLSGGAPCPHLLGMVAAVRKQPPARPLLGAWSRTQIRDTI